MNVQNFSNGIIKRSESFAEILSACSTLLKYSENAKDIRKYLNSRIPLNVQKKYNIGYFPENKNLKELFELVSKETLVDLGLVYDKYVADNNLVSLIPNSIFNYHNLIMPYKNLYGDIIAVVGRTLLSSDERSLKKVSKYKNSAFVKRLHLFNLMNAKEYIIEKNAVILVEGQFVCISCYRYGFKNVVAVGSANLSKHQFFILNRYTDNFYLLFDNDKAGQEGMENAIKRYSSNASFKKINLPEKYKDIDEYLNDNENFDILEI